MRITINLLPGAKKRKAGGAGLAMPDFGALAARIKDPLLIGAVASWMVGLSVIGWVGYTQTSALNDLQPLLTRTQNEARNLSRVISEKGRQTALRDSLVSELDAIRGIDSDRFVWPHIMEEVSRALPEFTWIVALDAVTVQDQLLDDGTMVAAPVQFSKKSVTLPTRITGDPRFRLRFRSGFRQRPCHRARPDVADAPAYPAPLVAGKSLLHYGST